jgi:glycosyltransferase involved in cell wall biosynthesis
MICAREEPFADLAIASVIDWCKEIIIVGDPNDETRKKIFSHPYSKQMIKLIWRAWDGDYGAARQMAADNATGYYILQLDMDEVIGDTAYLLEEYTRKNIDAYDMKYRHFVWNFGLEDATVPEHIGLNRLFRRKAVVYGRQVHEFAESAEWDKKGVITDVVIWHLGYCVKGPDSIMHKYHMNKSKLDAGEPSHLNIEYLEWWKNAHIFGTYPVKPVNPKELPIILKTYLNVKI